MDILLVPLFKLLDSILSIASFIVMSRVVLELLFNFGLLTMKHQFLCRSYELLRKLTDPFFDYVGRFVPNIGGFDISPMIIILTISFVRNMLSMLAVKLLG